MSTWCLEEQVVEAEGQYTTLHIPLDTRMIPGETGRVIYRMDHLLFPFKRANPRREINMSVLYIDETGNTAWDNHYMLVL